MRAGQHDRSGCSVEVGSQPVCSGDAPAVTGIQAGEPELRRWRTQVVSDVGLVLEKLSTHHCADRVATNIAWIGIATAVAVPARHWLGTAGFEGFAEHVASSWSGHEQSLDEGWASAGKLAGRFTIALGGYRGSARRMVPSVMAPRPTATNAIVASGRVWLAPVTASGGRVRADATDPAGTEVETGTIGGAGGP